MGRPDPTPDIAPEEPSLNSTTQNPLVRVRLSGAPAAVALVASRLGHVPGIRLLETSPDYRNRRDPGVRRYLTVLVVEAAGRG